MTSFPYVVIEGSGYERGLQYGSKATEHIHKSLDIYLSAFEHRGLDGAEVRERAARFVPVIEDFDGELFQELRGIADGAGLELEQVVALNARTELLHTDDSGCTAAACLAEVTVDGRPLLGQNWDWRPVCRDSAILLHVRPSDGPELITFVEAGLLARCGLNSAGIGVAGNFLQSAHDFGQSGIPVPLIRRKILTCTTLADALAWVIRTPRAFSSNHLIADAGGVAISLETTPERVFVVHPEGGILEHSNHFRSPAAVAAVQDLGIERYPDTLYRDRRLRLRLEAHAPNIGVEHFQEALRDHYGLPCAICRHLPPDAGESTIVTVASVVMDLAARRMWVAPGPVCENAYTDVAIAGDSFKRIRDGPRAAVQGGRR
jgi:isopenicillin-N N-acyltransferase-like protein